MSRSSCVVPAAKAKSRCLFARDTRATRLVFTRAEDLVALHPGLV